MANNLANILRTSYEYYWQTLGDQANDVDMWARQVDGQEPIMQRADLYGLGEHSAQTSSDPTAQDLDTSKTSTQRTVYEALVTVNEVDLTDTPRLASDITGMMAERAAYKLRSLMYTQLAASDTTVHPSESGGNVYGPEGGSVGQTVYYADDFLIDPPNGAAFNQSNLGNAALSATSLQTALTALGRWRGKDGLRAPADVGDLILIVPTELRYTAAELVDSDTSVYDGSGLVKRFRSFISHVHATSMLTDTNDWALINRTLSPYKWWVRTPAALRITPAPAAGRVHFYSSVTCNCVIEPDERGLYFSKVS